MSALTYYLYANIYILLFWLFFHFLLRKESFFQGLRAYLLGSVLLSAVLPLFAFLTSPITVVHIYEPVYIALANDFGSIGSAVVPLTTQEMSWTELLKYIIVSGGVIAFMAQAFHHFRIHTLIRRSTVRTYGRFKVVTTSENLAPFLYFRNIVLPDTLSKEETRIVIEHESHHYSLAHTADNLLLQLFQLVFWFNPIIYFIKRDLKQVHEFQVDQRIVKSDIDVSRYQLLLLKFSVGYQKFAIANGLSNSKIKNRIDMMNKSKKVSWKWKFLLFIPAFAVVFSLLSFSQSKVRNSPARIERSVMLDTVTVVHIHVPESAFSDINVDDDVVVFINKKSALLVDHNVRSFKELQQTVYTSFQQKTSAKLNLTASELLKHDGQETRIYVRKDRKTNEADYNKLVETLSECISELQDFYSNKIFGKSFRALTSDEKTQIGKLIKPVLYVMEPKQTDV